MGDSCHSHINIVKICNNDFEFDAVKYSRDIGPFSVITLIRIEMYIFDAKTVLFKRIQVFFAHFVRSHKL